LQENLAQFENATPILNAKLNYAKTSIDYELKTEKHRYLRMLNTQEK